MADVGQKAEKELKEITECPICMSAFTDPRMLPCIHTFCSECLKRTVETSQKDPGDKMPCPLCRKEFIIPADGINGVQKNFFMENLLQYKTTLQMGSVAIICDICNARDEGKTEGIPAATMRCLECEDNYCDSCVKVHPFEKLSRNHQVVKIGSATESEMKRISSVKYCLKHTQKPLDYYCAECKKIVCVSCFVESHKSHDCKDVTTVEEEFRQAIGKNAWHISNYADEVLSLRKNKGKRKADFIKDIFEEERKINTRNQELKAMIDTHTKSLLHDLSVARSSHLKEMENEMEEIERRCTILKSFEAYCTELRLKGSASDICSSVDQLIGRANELEKDHEAFIGRPHQSVEVSFQATDLGDVLQNDNSNFVGNVNDTTTQLENCAIVVGLDDGPTITEDVLKINLHRSKEVSTLEEIPTTMTMEAVAAVYCNTIYVTGIGANNDDIWKYKVASGWMKCASLVQGRRRHSAAFIDEVLYICGGLSDSTENVLDSVETYNAVTNKCTTMGKLAHGVRSSGNCVPFRSSLYIFGGSDKDGNDVSHVQMYNTKENTCTLLSKPMPRAYNLMRAVLWETSVMLLGCDSSFIFNIETETWAEREQFKTNVSHFGLVLENERVFVIGGGNQETDKDGNGIWKCRDDVRYVRVQNFLDDKPIESKIHATLPKPSVINAYEKVTFVVP